MIHITGDTEGKFGRIEKFCECFDTTKEDIMITWGCRNKFQWMEQGLREEKAFGIFANHIVLHPWKP